MGIVDESYRYFRITNQGLTDGDSLTISLFSLLPNFKHTYTANGIEKKIYIDGTLKLSGAESGAIANTGTKVKIGNIGHMDIPLFGNISNFKIYDKVLNAEEIKLL